MLYARFFITLRNEFLNWSLWSTRAIILTYAALTGLTVVGLTRLSEFTFDRFLQISNHLAWLSLLWTPLCTVGIVYLTRRWAPGAAGSGIPQVIAALDPQCPPDRRSLFISLKLSLSKALLTASGLLAGLSLGREGPSVQIGAGIMRNARHWLPANTHISEASLIMAGGAAGIAAAFNTPLGGVMFAIEELSKSLEQRSNGLNITAIVLAGLIAISIDGNKTYFGAIDISDFNLNIILPCGLVVLLSGILGGIFSKVLIMSLQSSKNHLGNFRRQHPLFFAGICGFLVALIGLISHGETFGTGYTHTQAIIDQTGSSSYFFVPLKFVATWLSTWSGVPAGIFAPSLAIGGGIGESVSHALSLPHAQILIAIGMAGFLAAVTQAPLTSFIIVMEMIDGHGLVLSLMASAFISAGLSRMVGRPLYPSLAKIQLLRLKQ